jgi:hypothetical protein
MAVLRGPKEVTGTTVAGIETAAAVEATVVCTPEESGMVATLDRSVMGMSTGFGLRV